MLNVGNEEAMSVGFIAGDSHGQSAICGVDGRVVYTEVDLIVVIIDVSQEIGFKLCDVFNVTVGRVGSSKECEVVKEVGCGVGVFYGVAFFYSRGAVVIVDVMM